MKNIDVLNSSLTSLYITVIYNVPGKKDMVTFKSPEVKDGKLQVINMLDDAYAILLMVNYVNYSGSIKRLFAENFTKAIQKCYEVYGDANIIKYQVADCSKLQNLDYVYINNKSSDYIKGRLIYTVGKEGINEESLPTKPGRGITLRAANGADNIQLSIFILNPKSSTDWRLIYTLNIGRRPFKLCYEVIGSFNKGGTKNLSCPNSSLIGLDFDFLKNEICFCEECPCHLNCPYLQCIFTKNLEKP